MTRSEKDAPARGPGDFASSASSSGVVHTAPRTLRGYELVTIFAIIAKIRLDAGCARRAAGFPKGPRAATKDFPAPAPSPPAAPCGVPLPLRKPRSAHAKIHHRPFPMRLKIINLSSHCLYKCTRVSFGSSLTLSHEPSASAAEGRRVQRWATFASCGACDRER